ncbi:MAG: tetratricopeptide repeat protein [Hyphomicrobiales bacterium]|nr:tetratricopeptide repeat protein [Hyphomicrobiales bacterium]MBV8823961.1 tetratricopeptide repeat protein [Hyphomicrobiales bacterium]
MPHDLHGLPITTSPEAAQASDRTVLAYLKYKVDAPEHLKRTLAADPEFALAHCLKGYFAMLSYKQANVAVAAEAAKVARAHVAQATPRERAHVDALEAWIAGDLERMIAVWEAILAEHPADVLALRLAHFNNFWLGRPHEMAASVARVLPKWGRELPGYGTLLSCRAFALEECGDYAGAEPAGRAAVEIDPADVWGTHAVAHIMEMQGRHAEGIAWLDQLERHWVGANNLLHHLWWHRALYHLERGEHAEVLALYDRRFRDLSSPLTKAQPDLYIDVQNAASMLFRLERRGVDVGDRWNEIADKAEARIGDCLSAFTLPHWMMALAATGREDTARRMLDGMHAFAGNGTTTGRIVGDIAVPICQAVLAHRRGEAARAVSLIRPVLDDMHRLGASHAQQDVLEQLFLDAAMKADSADDVRRLLARVARHPVPPHGRVGYAEAAKIYLH